MDAKDAAAPAIPPDLITRLRPDGFNAILGLLADELLRRGIEDKSLTGDQSRLYMKASSRLVEARSLLRDLKSALRPLAPPVPDAQHGADAPGGPHVRAPSGAGSTTGGAGGVVLRASDRCFCGHTRANHATVFGRCVIDDECPCEEFNMTSAARPEPTSAPDPAPHLAALKGGVD